MNSEELTELAALYSIGALDGEDLERFERLLERGDANAKAELESFQEVADVMGSGMAPAQGPTSNLKERILGRIEATGQEEDEVSDSDDETAKPSESLQEGFTFLRAAEHQPWISLPVSGAYVKPLSMNRERGYAVVMGKLDPGASYPAHNHRQAEDVFVLSGDLHIGDVRLEAGDFHHADAGTRHEVNYSQNGCVILVVLSQEDLVAQFPQGDHS